jgi:hypothetical protein
LNARILETPVLENFTAVMPIYLFIAQFMKNQFLMKNDMPRKSQRTRQKEKKEYQGSPLIS